MPKILISWFKGGKTNTAMLAMIAIYALNKYFDIQITETDLVAQIAVVVGVVGQLHKVFKSETVQKIKKGINDKKK